LRSATAVRVARVFLLDPADRNRSPFDRQACAHLDNISRDGPTILSRSYDWRKRWGIPALLLSCSATLRLSPATLLCKKSAGRSGKDRHSEDGFRVCHHDTFSSSLA
jgi:hypothetical protein